MTGVHSKFTREEINLIRAAVAERTRLRKEALKLSNEELAKKMGTSPTTISSIINYYHPYRRK